MAIVETKHPRSIIHSNIIRLSLDPSRCLPVYIAVLMTYFAHRVGRLKRGQEDAYTFMNTGRLAELRIPVPPLPSQEQFAALVARHERLRAVQRESLRHAEHLFQALLHRAFASKRE
jgi:type I restriction enzyme S subunit